LKQMQDKERWIATEDYIPCGRCGVKAILFEKRIGRIVIGEQHQCTKCDWEDDYLPITSKEQLDKPKTYDAGDGKRVTIPED
jgi:hypothetical protein